MKFNIKVVAKILIFLFIATAIILLLYYFIVDGITWEGFIEFIISCLILIFLVEKVNIKIPGLFEIKNEMEALRKEVGSMAQAISQSNAKASIEEHYHLVDEEMITKIIKNIKEKQL